MYLVVSEEFFAVGQMMGLGRSGCGERRLDAFRMGHFQGAVHFVGRDMVEAFAFVFFRQTFPINFSGLQQAECAQYVGTGKGKRVFDTAVYMAFSRQMDDTVYMVLLHDFLHFLVVADIGFDESVVRLVFDVLQIGQVTGVGQFIQVDNVILGIFVDEQTDYMAADESAPPVINILRLNSMIMRF